MIRSPALFAILAIVPPIVPIAPIVPIHPAVSIQVPENAPPSLRIVAAGGDPFVVADPEGGPASGLSIDVWNAVASHLGLAGEMTAAANVDAALDQVAAGEADIAVGPISITHSRAERVRFTQPYFNSMLGIAAPPGGTLLDRFSPFLTATFLTGAAVLVGVLLLVGTLLWLAERRQNPEHFPVNSSGVGNGIWMALVTMTTVGYGDRVPQTVAGRVITGVWMLVSLVIASSLTAFLATALTLSQMDASTIRSEEQFDQNRIAVVSGSTSEAFARARGARVVAFETLAAAADGVAAGDSDAIVFDRPMLQYLMVQNPDLNLDLAPSGYEPQNYGFAAGLDEPLVDDLSLAILELQESGELLRIVESWLGAGGVSLSRRPSFLLQRGETPELTILSFRGWLLLRSPRLSAMRIDKFVTRPVLPGSPARRF